jgi:large conductance mechanosensitive channel
VRWQAKRDTAFGLQGGILGGRREATLGRQTAGRIPAIHRAPCESGVDASLCHRTPKSRPAAGPAVPPAAETFPSSRFTSRMAGCAMRAAMKILEEFKAFIMRGNILTLAIAFVIGLAFTQLVSETVDALIKPLLGMILAGKGIEVLNFTYCKLGDFLMAVVRFVAMGAVIFFVFVKPLTRLGLLPPEEKKDGNPPPPPPPADK